MMRTLIDLAPGAGDQRAHAGPVVSRKPGLVPDSPHATRHQNIKMKSKNALVLRPPRTAQLGIALRS